MAKFIITLAISFVLVTPAGAEEEEVSTAGVWSYSSQRVGGTEIHYVSFFAMGVGIASVGCEAGEPPHMILFGAPMDEPNNEVGIIIDDGKRHVLRGEQDGLLTVVVSVNDGTAMREILTGEQLVIERTISNGNPMVENYPLHGLGELFKRFAHLCDMPAGWNESPGWFQRARKWLMQ